MKHQERIIHESNNKSQIPSIPERIQIKLRTQKPRKCKEKSVNIVDGDSPTRSSNQKNVVGSDSSSDLVPCLLCNDNKLYKKKGGLKIHCVRRHKNQEYGIMFDETATGEKFDVNSLIDKIGYYKRNVRILKRIPKAARMLAAYELAKLIEKTVEKNDSSSWEELLLFPYKAFQVHTRK